MWETGLAQNQTFVRYSDPLCRCNKKRDRLHIRFKDVAGSVNFYGMHAEFCQIIG